MQFGILGPVEVWLADRPALPGTQQLAMLAALLLGANRVQDTEWLIEVVWGDARPPAAGERLAALAGQLRRVLGRRLTVRSDGYLLAVEPAQLDLSLFEEAVKQAKVDLAARDYPAASAGLHAALSLWRGDALANVDSRLLRDVEAPRLEERRLSALEDRIEADLRLGRHAGVVAELRRLVTTHPLRERFWRQLIISLYRCAQREAALATYDRAERTMRALGVRVSGGLRNLALAVRTDHPSLGPPDHRQRR